MVEGTGHIVERGPTRSTCVIVAIGLVPSLGRRHAVCTPSGMLPRSFLTSFGCFLLVAFNFGCSNAAATDETDSTAMSDVTTTASELPSCNAASGLEGKVAYRSAVHANIFFVPANEWHITRVEMSSAFESDIQGPRQARLLAASPFHGRDRVTFEIERVPADDVATWRKTLAAAYPDAGEIEIRPMTLTRVGEPEVTWNPSATTSFKKATFSALPKATLPSGEEPLRIDLDATSWNHLPFALRQGLTGISASYSFACSDGQGATTGSLGFSEKDFVPYATDTYDFDYTPEDTTGRSSSSRLFSTRSSSSRPSATTRIRASCRCRSPSGLPSRRKSMRSSTKQFASAMGQ